MNNSITSIKKAGDRDSIDFWSENKLRSQKEIQEKMAEVFSNQKPALVLAKSDLDEEQGAAHDDTAAYKQYVRMSESAATQLFAKDDEIKQKWIKLCDYGNHQHSKGLQKLTLAAAQKMASKHRSLYARLKRYFGGTPVYIGHPDDPAFAKDHTDSRAYAWVHQLEARKDGLWILPTWSEAGKKLLKEAHYKYLSPRWKVTPLGDGSFEPTELISIGLTNNPNILGPTIANEASLPEPEEQETPEQNLLAPIAEKLNLAADATLEQILAAIDELLPQEEEPTQANQAQREPQTFMSNTLQDYATTRQTLREKFVADVQNHMTQTGEDFSTAWASIKAKRKEIFNQLNHSTLANA